MINILLALFLSSTATAQVVRQNGAGPLTGSALTPASVAATGAAGISFNVLGTSTIAVVGGGIGYIPYTLATTTTTTTAGGEITFSTMTVPANSFNRAGQGLRITCNFTHSQNTNNITPKMYVNNNSGTLTSIGTGSAAATAGSRIHMVAELTWLSPSLWTDMPFALNSSSLIASPANGTQTFNESNPIIFNCDCTGGTANGDCSFLDMRMEWMGM